MKIAGKSLFRRAIVDSGSALASWSLASDPLLYTRRLADHFNCSNGGLGSSIATIQCLRQYSVDDLVSADIRPPKYLTSFGPTVDGRSVLPPDHGRPPGRTTTTATNDGSAPCLDAFGSTDLLVGVGRRDGAEYFPQARLDDGLTLVQRTKALRTYVQNVYRYHQQKIYDILAHNYRDWDRPVDPETSRDELVELVGDGQHVAPTIQLAKDHAACRAAATFLFGFAAEDADGAARRSDSSRPNEMAYVFGAPLADGIDPFVTTYTEQDKALSEKVLSYWTSFIRTGLGFVCLSTVELRSNGFGYDESSVITYHNA